MNRLFWIVYGEGEQLKLIIQPAVSMANAQLKATVAGIKEKCSLCFELYAKKARKVPKRLIGKPLDHKQAILLLKKLG